MGDYINATLLIACQCYLESKYRVIAFEEDLEITTVCWVHVEWAFLSWINWEETATTCVFFPEISKHLTMLIVLPDVWDFSTFNVVVACSFCESNEFFLHFSLFKYSYNRCSNCSSGRLKPLPNADYPVHRLINTGSNLSFFTFIQREKQWTTEVVHEVSWAIPQDCSQDLCTATAHSFWYMSSTTWIIQRVE